MKKILVFTILGLLCSYYSMAQTDSLGAGVYSAAKNKPQKMGSVEKKEILSGKTLDINHFEVYTLTLGAGKKYTPPTTDNSFERLIVIKSGSIRLVLKDSSKMVGPGSLALVLADDEIKFENTSNAPVSWYVLKFQSKNENNQRGHNAGPSFIKDWNFLKATISPKGETRMVFDRPTTMFERFDVHATVLNNGYNSHDPHTHRAEELILMINGDSQFQIGQEKFHAYNGDAVLMASKILHAAQNNGTAPCGYYAIQWHNLKGD
jgi:(S)-ureidoglycine aminohydrolase